MGALHGLSHRDSVHLSVPGVSVIHCVSESAIKFVVRPLKTGAEWGFGMTSAT